MPSVTMNIIWATEGAEAKPFQKYIFKNKDAENLRLPYLS